MLGKCHSKESRKKMSEKAKCRAPISEETKKKMSLSRSGEKNYMFGKQHSEETKKKISERTKEYMRGMKYWNNGTINKRSKECPGDGWVRGRLKRK